MADDNNKSYDLTRKIIGEVLVIARKTLELLTDNKVATAILNVAGVNAQGAPNAPAPDLAALDAIQTFSDKEGAAELAELVELLVNIDDAINPYRLWLTTIVVGSDEAKIRQIVSAIFMVSFYLVLRERFPASLRALQAAGFFKDGLPDYEANVVTLKVLEDLFIGDIFRDAPHTSYFLLAVGWYLLELFEVIPSAQGRMLFGWQPGPDSLTPLADEIADRTLTVSYENKAFDEAGGGRAQMSSVWVSGDQGGPGVMVSLGGALRVSFPIRTTLLEMEMNVPTAAVLFFGNDTSPFENPDLRLEVALRRDTDLALESPTLNLGASYLSFGHYETALTVTAERADIQVNFSDTELYLKDSGSSSFLNAILPEKGLHARITLGLKYDLLNKKLSISEGTSMRVVIPVGGDGLAGVRIPYLTVDLSFDTAGDKQRLITEISATVEIKWGAVTITIERTGLQVFTPRRANTAGLAGLAEFKLPSGAGFALKTDTVSGGGYLFNDVANKEWGGVVNLDINKAISLTALGLIKEDLPGAPNDFAMVIMGSFEMKPGLGPLFGAYLQGMGLLYAYNRTIDIEVLREGVKTGLIDSVLFPDDPVANAPQILNDMRRLFPIARERRAIAILLKIAFGEGGQGRLKLGVAIDWPAPKTLAVLGSLTIRLPNLDAEKPAAQILADMALIWDEAARLISFDAALRDSHVADGLTLTGEMAARWKYGDNGTFIAAIGGFHPAFDASADLPQNAQMPRVERLTIALGSGSNPRVRALGYLALTSNSVQAGFRAEIIVRKSGFTLEGWLGVDGLFQKNPYRMTLDFEAGVKIRRGRRVLFSLTLEGRIEAFSPTCITGKVKFKILFWTVKIPVSLNIGEARVDLSVDVDIGPQLIETLSKDRAWAEGRPATFSQVAAFGTGSGSQALSLHPSTLPSVRQGLVPLGLTLDQYEGARIIGEKKFEVTLFVVNGQTLDPRPVKDHFAPGHYFDLSDDEKLSRPSFEIYSAGASAGDDGYDTGPGEDAALTYETILIDKRTDRRRKLGDFAIDRAAFVAALPYGAASQSGDWPRDGFAGPRRPALPAGPVSPGFVITAVADMTLADALTPVSAPYATVRNRLDEHLRHHPEHNGQLQIVGAHQVTAHE